MAIEFSGRDVVVRFHEDAVNQAIRQYKVEYQCETISVIHYVDVNNSQSTTSDGLRVYKDQLTYEENASAGLTRQPRVILYAQNADFQWSDGYTIDGENPLPVLPAAPAITGTVDGITVTLQMPSDRDLEGFVAWIGSTADFPLDDAHERYRGKASSFNLQLPDDSTYYLRVAPYDAFGLDTFSAWNAMPVSRAGLGSIIDTAPPAAPSNLVLTSTFDTDTDGSQIVNLVATWTTSAGVAGYDFALREGDSDVWSVVKVTEPRFERFARGNISYFAKVRSFDRFNNVSDYTTEFELVTSKDTTPPSPPFAVVANGRYATISLEWSNPGEHDLAHVRIYESAQNNIATAVQIAVEAARPGTAGSYSRTGLTTDLTRFYWLRAEDTSGNLSDPSAVVSAFTAALTNVDFTPGLEVPGTGTSLPDPAAYPGNLFLNTSDGNLYRKVAGAWKRSVDADEVEVGAIGGGNLLKNSSFDSSRAYVASSGPFPSGFTPYNNTPSEAITTSFVPGRRGGEAIQVSFASNATTKGIYLDANGGVNNRTIWRHDQWFVWSMWVKGSGSALGRTLAHLWNYAPADAEWLANPPVTADWQRYVLKLRYAPGQQIDAQGFITIASGLSSPGVIVFDDMQVEEGEVATAYAPAVIPGEITRPLIAPSAVGNNELAADSVTGNKVVAQTLTGQHIVSDTMESRHFKAQIIQGQHLETGTLTTGLFAAGAVTATKAAFGGGPNLLPDPSFMDVDYWSNSGVVTGKLRTTNAGGGWYHAVDANGQAQIGLKDYITLWSGAGPAIGTSSQALTSNSFPIQAQTVYELSATVYNPSNQTAWVRFTTVAANGNSQSYDLNWPAFTAGPKSIQITTTGVINCFIRIFNNGSPQPSFANYIHVGNIRVMPAALTTTIADGVITSPKVVSRAILSDHVDAEAILARHVKTGELDASKLTVGAKQLLSRNLLDSTAFWGSAAITAAGPKARWTWNDWTANSWFNGVSPSGSTEKLLRVVSNNPASAGGGWDTALIAEDGWSPEKSYRYYTWVYDESGAGSIYYGCQNVTALDGSANGNPYFFSYSKGALPRSRWLLMVGIIHGAGSTPGYNTNQSGVYDPITGKRILAGTDYKWATGVPSGAFRSYQFYASSGSVAYFTRPVVEEIISGQTVSIQSLLQSLDPAAQINTGVTTIDGGKLTADSVTSREVKAKSLTADRMNVTSLDALSANMGTITAGLLRNTAGTAQFDLNNSRILFNNGTVMKVTGLGFGSSNQFLEWAGPSLADVAQCTEANAIQYLKTNGAAYFGGTLNAGILSNSSQSSGISFTPSHVLGPIGSNGRQRTITASWGRTQQQAGFTRAREPQWNNVQISGTLRLFRGTSAAGQLLAQQAFTGSTSVEQALNGDPGGWSQSVNGSITFTDNTGGTADQSFYADVINVTAGTFTGSASGPIGTSQRLAITCIEQ